MIKVMSFMGKCLSLSLILATIHVAIGVTLQDMMTESEFIGLIYITDQWNNDNQSSMFVFDDFVSYQSFVTDIESAKQVLGLPLAKHLIYIEIFTIINLQSLLSKVPIINLEQNIWIVSLHMPNISDSHVINHMFSPNHNDIPLSTKMFLLKDGQVVQMLSNVRHPVEFQVSHK